jgi:hypothetical protein
MAHYIAELIEDAETAKVGDRPEKLTWCADAILKLWERRHQLPNGKRPFEDLEPILRAFESLDPASDIPRYFRSPRLAADETEQNAGTTKWLELADSLDYSARILIRHCLAQAAQTALDRSKNWVKLAEGVGMEDGIDLQVIRFIIDESDVSMESEPDDRARRIFEDRIKRLDDFKKMAVFLASDLRRQLKKSQAPKVGS